MKNIENTRDFAHWRDLIERGAWRELANNLGFATEHSAEIPPAAYELWGICAEAAAHFSSLNILAAAPEYRLIHIDQDAVNDGDGAGFSHLRRLIHGVWRHNPELPVLWWWTRSEKLTVAMAGAHADGRFFVRRMDLERPSPDAISLAQFLALDMRHIAASDAVERTSALSRHLAETLGQQRMTREFFVGFRRALKKLVDTMRAGPTDPQARHDVALATLLRLVFLYFLQARGALDGDRRFVLRHLRQARATGLNFYNQMLRPLFFGALNRPKNARDEAVAQLGELPFLNGGLFEPLPVEVEFSRLSWPDQVWAEVIEELLERYRFAVEEMQGPDEQRAVDPEMLGRVFEGLMFGSARQRSGSFYTPRDIVRKLVDEALAGYLADHTNLSSTQVAALLRGEAVTLGDHERQKVCDALDSVKILDPAVGTGAFLLEALQVLRRLQHQLQPQTNPDSPLAEYRRVRELIHTHLFGVDIQSTAVRLCELRLWLVLLTTLPNMAIDQMPPLPNLSHKICVGNSLLSSMDLLRLRAGATSFVAGDQGVEPQLLLDISHSTDLLGAELPAELPSGSIREMMADLRRAHAAYLVAHGPAKIDARRQVQALEYQLQILVLSIRHRRLLAKFAPIRALEQSEDLFGEKTALNSAQAAQKKQLLAELNAIETAQNALSAHREAPPGFDYAVRFGALLEDAGGFDIIITNPPWVRAQLIDAAQLPVLRAKYRSEQRTLWPDAQKTGIRVPFGPQVDLAALFIERSLELLRPGGRLCGLVPAKLFTSLHGAALREFLAEHALVAIEDYSDGSRQLFDATVYPAMLHVKKRQSSRNHPTANQPANSSPADRAIDGPGMRLNKSLLERAARPVRMTVWQGDAARHWQVGTPALFSGRNQPGAPWIFAEPPILKIFEQMRENSIELGKIDLFQPMRGLFTGNNDVFIADADKFRPLLGEDFERLSRPVLSGRDIRPWATAQTRRILWPYDSALNPRAELPEKLMRYFQKHRRALEKRSDFHPDRPLWQLFRISRGLVQPKAVWRDMSPCLQAAVAPADILALNTVYFIPCADEFRAYMLAALFNSSAMRAIAYALAERARGGWRRHFAWVMRLLPVPRPFLRMIRGEDAALMAEFQAQFAPISNLSPTGARIPAAPGAAEQARLDHFMARLFGLSAADLHQLSAWQRGREVA